MSGGWSSHVSAATLAIALIVAAVAVSLAVGALAAPAAAPPPRYGRGAAAKQAVDDDVVTGLVRALGEASVAAAQAARKALGLE